MTTATITNPRTVQFQQGFLGEGHMAAAVIDGSRFSQTDPFILLMDDRLALPGNEPVGGAHPHAGFETVTLVLKGNDKEWETGSLELMTAGKGIVHTEEITEQTKLHILQLWLALPPSKRWAEPFVQKIAAAAVPVYKTDDVIIRIYSGDSNGIQSPLVNNTGLLLTEFTMKANAKVQQIIPASYNGFIYVLEGKIKTGDKEIHKHQVAWFDTNESITNRTITINAEEEKAHFVLYAAQPHGAGIVSHGPFIGDTREDIARLYQEYREGKMPHVNGLPAGRTLIHKAAALQALSVTTD